MRLGKLLVAAVLSSLPVAAYAEQQPLEAGRENTGRVSTLEGESLFGRGPYDEETWELSANAILREGDEVFTEDGTFAELELPGGTFVRLDAFTSIVVQRLSEQGVELALSQGNVYVSRGSQARPVVVQTFGGAVDLGGNSMARVGADRARTQLDVKVAKGSAEMRTDKNAIAVPESKTLVWTRNGSRQDPWDATRYDAFDRWNATREDLVRGITRSEYVASGAIGAYELEGNGTWVVIDGHRAWQPTVVYADWRPYSSGYWTWCEPYGWTWVDYYGWGYTTSHYGRWYYRSHYGWVWYPDPYWGGAWVVWAAFGPNIGWAPCDFWGRPIYVYNYYSYYDYGAWCYTDSDYFYYGGGYRPRNSVRTSTSRSYSAGRRGAAHTSVGRGNGYTIRTFDANSIREHSAVPVRNPVRDLTPKPIADAAGRGALRGVKAEQRRGEFLAKAVKEGGVRPEPWERGSGRNALGDTARGGLRGGDAGRGGEGRGRDLQPDRGIDAGRSADGWGRRGETGADRAGEGRGGFDGRGTSRGNEVPDVRDGGRGNDSRGNEVRGSDGWGRGNDATRGNDAGRGNDTRGNDAWPGNDTRGNGSRSNDAWRGGSSSQPSRSNEAWTPPARTEPRREEPQRSQPAPRVEPPKQERSSPPARKDPPKREDKPKPRATWDYGGGGSSSRGGSAYGYQAPSRSSGSSERSRSSYSAPSYSAPSRGSSSSSKPSYSAPSYSAPSRGSSSSSSKPSYSAPSRSSSSSSSKSSSSSSSSSSSKRSSSSSDSGKRRGR